MAVVIQLIDKLLIEISATRINKNDTSLLYKVVSLTGKGKGIIATKNITPSTIIISEKSLLRERKIENEIERYKALIDAYNSLDDKLEKPQMVRLSSCFGENTNRNEIIDIYYTNAITIFNNKKYESGLFPNIARTNHSCIPNAFVIYEDNIMTLRALFHINKGQEITISYLKPFKYTFQQRQEILLQKYRFKCTCNLCLENVYNRNKMDKIIIKYRDLVQNNTINHIQAAISILDEQFNGYPMLKMNLLSRCADILIDQYLKNDGNDEKDDELYNECLKYIEKSIIIGLQCYGDKQHNKSDWSETRRRIAQLRWTSGDPQQKCTKLMNKWQYLF